MAIRRITSKASGGEPPSETAPPVEETKLSYAEAREQAEALVRQLSGESNSLKAWATLYARYKTPGSRVEIGDLTKFVLSQPDEPELVARVLQDMLQSGIPMYFEAMVEKIGNRRLLEYLGDYHSSDLASKLYIIFSTTRVHRSAEAITEAVKGTRMDNAILCLQWMRQIYSSCDELTRATILSYVLRFHHYKLKPTEQLGQLNAALDAIVRKGLADPSAMVAWSSFELGRSLGWPVSIIDQAMPLRARPAANSGSPEFGMPFYLSTHMDFLRCFAWTVLTNCWQSPLQPGTLALGDLRPIHSLADFNPDEARRTPVLEVKLKRLERLIKNYGNGREVLDHFLFGAGATKEGRQIMVCELKTSGENYQWFATQGHHRLAALYVGGQRGIVPESWLSHIPVHIIQDNGKIPSRLARQVMTDNYDFGWQDLLPPDYADGRSGAKPRGKCMGVPAGRPRGLQPQIQMAPALWRARTVGAAPLTMRTHRH